MSDPIVTNNETRGIVVWEPVFEDETLTATGAETWPAGTLLGRIAVNGKLTAYTSGASDGSETPVAVLRHELEFTGAGDLPCRPIISGQVRLNDLVAFGVGAITVAEADALRNYSIIPRSSTQLAEQDNQ